MSTRKFSWVTHPVSSMSTGTLGGTVIVTSVFPCALHTWHTVSLQISVEWINEWMNEVVAPSQIHTHIYIHTHALQVKAGSIFSVQQDTSLSFLTGRTWSHCWVICECMPTGPISLVQLKLSDGWLNVRPSDSSSYKSIFLGGLR